MLGPKDHPFLSETDFYQASMLCGSWAGPRHMQAPDLAPALRDPTQYSLLLLNIGLLGPSPDLERVSVGPSRPHCLFSLHSCLPSGAVLQPLCTVSSSRPVCFTSSDAPSALFCAPWRPSQTLYLTDSYWFLWIQFKSHLLGDPFSDPQSY